MIQNLTEQEFLKLFSMKGYQKTVQFLIDSFQKSTLPDTAASVIMLIFDLEIKGKDAEMVVIGAVQKLPNNILKAWLSKVILSDEGVPNEVYDQYLLMKEAAEADPEHLQLLKL